MRTIVVGLVIAVSAASWAADPIPSSHVSFKAYRPSMPIATGPALLDSKQKVKSNVDGWGLTSSVNDRYEVRCDAVYTNCVTQILRSRGSVPEAEMGSVTHTEAANAWRGRRIELRAHMKAGAVSGWVGVWMRVDDANGKALAFDDMRDRAVRGTTSFDWHSVVLDVPPEAEVIMGVMLNGEGAVMIEELSLNEVDRAQVTAVTDLLTPRLTAAATP